MNMSFSMTTAQVRAQAKDVTRRTGWLKARVGQVVQPIVKGQGLKKGEHIETIGGPIRFVNVRREALKAITPEDVAREGYPGRTPEWFIATFCAGNRGCEPHHLVTRIEFVYLEDKTTATGATDLREDLVHVGTDDEHHVVLIAGDSDVVLSPEQARTLADALRLKATVAEKAACLAADPRIEFAYMETP